MNGRPDIFRQWVVKVDHDLIEVRYPEEIIYLTDDSVREGIRVAKSIRNMVTDKAEIVIDYHEIIDSADFL